MSSSSPSSRSRHEKTLLFSDWGLLGDSQGEEKEKEKMKKESDVNIEDEKQSLTAPRLDATEIEHRRKSRAFAAAAAEMRAAGERADNARDKSKEKEVEEVEEIKEVRKVKKDDDVVEIIDLTGPPPPPPRRTVSAAVTSVRAAATLRRTASNPLPARDEPKKRKRNSMDSDLRDSGKKSSKAAARTESPPPALVPEPRRIFADLAFYYLPDAALGARKLRIAKAREHGARWVRSLREATHVVVDKHLSWGDLEGVLGDREDSETTPILVNDAYPLDCIAFRCLLNPDQRRYRIAGRPVPEETQPKEKKEKTGQKDNNRAPTPPLTGSTAAPPGYYAIKPDRKHRRRLGTAGSSPVPEPKAELMVRQPRKTG